MGVLLFSCRHGAPVRRVVYRTVDTAALLAISPRASVGGTARSAPLDVARSILPHGEWPLAATAPGHASVLDAPIDSRRVRPASARRRYADARGARRFSGTPQRVPQIRQKHQEAL